MFFRTTLTVMLSVLAAQFSVVSSASDDSPLRSSGDLSYFSDGRDPVRALDAATSYFGEAGVNRMSFSAITLRPYSSADAALLQQNDDAVACTGDCVMVGQVHLPTGALFFGLGVTGEDSDSTGDIEVAFEECSIFTLGCGSNAVVSIETGEAETPGGSYFYEGVQGGGLTINNKDNHYLVAVELTGGTGATAVLGVHLYWQRQISPAPVSATFTDVPTDHQFFQGIEALVASGITSGCGGSNYCPDSPVTRGQMAIFLARALGLHYDDT